jgi:hypothetical protein
MLICCWQDDILAIKDGKRKIVFVIIKFQIFLFFQLKNHNNIVIVKTIVLETTK